jgi:glycosyltransferase involved in cell wall biosynthesis
MATVLQVVPALESGGVERGTVEIANALVKAGHRSLVISAGGRLVTELEQGGSRHFTWRIGRKHPRTLRLIPRLRRFLRDQYVDIVHVRSRLPAWIAYLAWRSLPTEQRPRLVSTFHGFHSVNPYSAIMTRTERIIAVSECIRDHILRCYPHIEETRIQVIHRGIDLQRYPRDYQPTAHWLQAWRAQFPQLQHRWIVTLPGRITRLKGHYDLLDLVAGLKQAGIPAHGLIVGGAEPRKQHYLHELHAALQQRQLTQDISFTGQRDDMREILAISDIVLSLSRSPESFGRTTLEALAMNRPVLGYDHGGVGEQLQYLYPHGRIVVGDSDMLLERAVDWYRNGAPSGPLHIPFTLDAMCQHTLTLYNHLITPCHTTLSV